MSFPVGEHLTRHINRTRALLPKESQNNPGFSQISWKNNTLIG